jgi:hypothetical protein
MLELKDPCSSQDVQEFHPYVFQVFAQLIELRPAPLPAVYMQVRWTAVWFKTFLSTAVIPNVNNCVRCDCGELRQKGEQVS